MGREQHVPDAFDHSRYLIELFSSSYSAGNSRENHVFRWFDFSSAPLPKGASKRVSADVALQTLVSYLSGLNFFFVRFTHKHTDIHTDMYVYIHIYIYTKR